MEALLRAGTVIKRYIYVDTQDVARRVMAARLEELHEHYQQQLPLSAFADAFTALPQDATHISTTALTLAGATDQNIRWVVVAGWPCQDFSPAGYRQGLDGVHAGAYHVMLHILAMLQSMQRNKPPTYLLENGPVQLATNPKNNLQRDFASITAQIGEPVLLDATQFGACAYRLRNWWTNLIDPALLRAITATVQRPPGLFVHQIPDSNHELTAVRRSNSPPCYSVNMGAELEALPTLMSRVGSYAFVLGEPGSLHIKGTDRYEEPSAEERERALGYATGTTRAPGVTNVQRRVLLGSCMDANCIQSIFAIVAAVYRHKGSPACMVQTNTSEQEVTGLARPPPLMSWLL